MSSKQPKEDKYHQSQVIPRCLAVVLKANKRDRRKSSGGKHDRERIPGWPGSSSPAPGAPQPVSSHGDRAVSPPQAAADAGPPTGGKAIFESFQKENSGCYWNPHLEESIRNLKYMGLIQHNTLLVCGRDIFLDTIRNAFARKVLMPPVGFTLHKLGELEPVQMSVVQQTQFTPLPEALCVVIHELNAENASATLDTVQDRLADRYRGMQPPPEEIVYETLGSLMKERKIYHTGSAGTGYFIVTPDTYKNGCFNQAHLNSPPQTPTLYVPVLTPASTEMRSISCQTEEKEPGEKAKGDKDDKRKSKLERSQSLTRKSNKEKKAESLGRTASLRLGDEKAKQVVKDINLRTSEANQDKDKGEKEKTSLFNKIFGRGKSRRSVAIEEDVEEEPEVEYATFSAQFPPPEWAWYGGSAQGAIPRMTSPVTTSPMTSQQLTSPLNHPHQQAAAAPPPMLRAHTLHPSQGVPHFDAGTQSEFDDEDYMKPCPHPSLPTNFRHHPHPQQLYNNHLQVNHLPRSSPSHSHESHSSSYELSPPLRSPRCQERESRRQRHGHRTSSKPRHHHPESSRHNTPPVTLAATPPVTNQNEYVQQDGEGSHIYCEPSNPADMPNDQSFAYEDAALSQSITDRLSPNGPQPHGHPLNNAAYKAEHAQRSKSLSSPPRQKGQVSNKYRDYNCASFCGNDISIEYKGKMPRKNGMFSLSRDSGVNCVGVKDTTEDGARNTRLSLKEKRFAFFNNNTGSKDSSNANDGQEATTNPGCSSSNGPQTPQTRVPPPDYTMSHSHQDSGFSSPRTDADHPNYSSELHVNLPLNNISLQSNNTNSNTRRPVSTERTSQSRSLPRTNSRAHGNSINTKNGLTNTGIKGHNTNGPSEKGKENHDLPTGFKSLESLHITSSEKYPSVGQLHHDSKDNGTSSSRSGSSKATVVEQSGDLGVAHGGGGGGAFSLYDPNMSRTSSDATYMEIQLVTSDCPVHGDSPRETPRSHSRVTKDPDVVINKRHSMTGKGSSRHHNAQWGQPRYSGSPHHFSSTPTNNNNMCGLDKEGKNHPSNSRLAFLGDCEVVGIL